MRLSREKINNIAHLVTDRLVEDESVTFLKEENDIRLKVMEIFLAELEIDDKVDAIARKRLESYSRQISEGGHEWNILYQKFYEQEMNKLGRL